MTVEFTNLPIEIYSEIFGMLPINDIFKCRRICKLFYNVIDNLRLRDLVIAEDEFKFTLNRKWFNTNKSIDITHNILCSSDPSELLKIESQLRKSIFSSIKKLFIHSNYLSFKSEDLGQCLNHFKRLENLEIENLEIQSTSRLILPNLKILNISNVRGDLCYLETPKLSTIKIQFLNHIDNIEFIYPLEIKHAEFIEKRDLLKKFKNLEYLYCKQINSIEDNFLINYSKLKQLHFDSEDTIFFKLKQQKDHLKRKELKIYYLGMCIDDLSQLSSAFNHSDLYEKNYKLLAESYTNNLLANKLPFISQINYNKFEENFKNLPNNLLIKFVNLEEVKVTKKIDNQLKFIKFLNCCTNFSNLKLNQSSLNTQFFNHQLPTYCPSLTSLTIKDENVEELDFNFLFKMKYLIKLITNKQLSIDFVYNLFKNLKHFQQIWFSNYEDKIRIVANESTSKILRLYINEKETQFYDLNEMFNYMRNNLELKMELN